MYIYKYINTRGVVLVKRYNKKILLEIFLTSVTVGFYVNIPVLEVLITDLDTIKRDCGRRENIITKVVQ